MKQKLTMIMMMFCLSVCLVSAYAQSAVAQGCTSPRFSVPKSYVVGNVPFSVKTGDFNSDGKLDLVTANSHSGTASILLGNGMGGFSAAMNFDAGNFPIFVTAGDLNLDGKPTWCRRITNLTLSRFCSATARAASQHRRI